MDFKKALVKTPMKTITPEPQWISCVPSWTETLLLAGATVIGCTRFCLYPENKIKSISRIGGTKNINFEILQQLLLKYSYQSPIYIVLDQEENTLQDFQNLQKLLTDFKNSHQVHQPIEILTTHVNSVKKLQEDLLYLFEKSNLITLKEYALKTERLKSVTVQDFVNLFIEHPSFASPQKFDPNKESHILIWNSPLMGIGPQTFAFDFLGEILKIPSQKKEKYPVLHEKDLTHKNLIYLTEPYPFHLKPESVNNFEGSNSFLISGELVTWFGARILDHFCIAP